MVERFDRPKIDLKEIPTDELWSALMGEDISGSFGEHFRPEGFSDEDQERLATIAASVPALIHDVSTKEITGDNDEDIWIPELKGNIFYEGIVGDFIDVNMQAVSVDSLRALVTKKVRHSARDITENRGDYWEKVASFYDREESRSPEQQVTYLRLLAYGLENPLVKNHQQAAFTPYHPNVAAVQAALERQARHTLTQRGINTSVDSEIFECAVHNLTMGMMQHVRNNLSALDQQLIIRFSHKTLALGENPEPKNEVNGVKKRIKNKIKRLINRVSPIKVFKEKNTVHSVEEIMRTPHQVRNAYRTIKAEMEREVSTGCIPPDQAEKVATIRFLKAMNAWPEKATMRDVQSTMNDAQKLYIGLINQVNKACEEETAQGKSAPFLDTNTTTGTRSFWTQIGILYDKDTRNGIDPRDLMEIDTMLIFWTTFWRLRHSEQNAKKHDAAQKLAGSVEKLSEKNREDIEVDRYEYSEKHREYRWKGTQRHSCVLAKEPFNNKKVRFYRQSGSPKGHPESVIKLIGKSPHLYDEQIKDPTRSREYCMDWTSDEVANDPKKLKFIEGRLHQVAKAMGVTKQIKTTIPKGTLLSDPEEVFERHIMLVNQPGTFLIEIDLDSDFPVAKLVGKDADGNSFEYQIGFLDTYIEEHAQNSPINHSGAYSILRELKCGKTIAIKSVVQEGTHECIDKKVSKLKKSRRLCKQAKPMLLKDLKKRRTARLAT